LKVLRKLKKDLNYCPLEDRARFREAGRVVATVLDAVRKAACPGMTTQELSDLAHHVCLENGAKPAFLGYRGFPAALCTSVNSEVVHGIPNNRRLKAGDILGVDFGAEKDGYCGDAAITIPIGDISEIAAKLLKTTEESLYIAIDQAVIGARVSNIGAAVQEYVEARGFSVVRDLVGHGVCRQMHVDPQIPNYGPKGQGTTLREGMGLAIEPMINQGSHEVRLAPDKWTVVTLDGKLSAHFEHTVLVEADGPKIMTLL